MLGNGSVAQQAQSTGLQNQGLGVRIPPDLPITLNFKGGEHEKYIKK